MVADYDCSRELEGEEAGSESEPSHGRSPGTGSKRKRGTSKHHSYKAWTTEEDAQLLTLVDELGASNWQDIAKAIPSRTAKSCRLRYVNQLRAEIVVGPFTPEEDAVLLQYHQVHGNKWTLVAKHLHGRTDNQVKNRWHSWLKKQPGVGVRPAASQVPELPVPEETSTLPGAWVPVPSTVPGHPLPSIPAAPASAHRASRNTIGKRRSTSGGGKSSRSGGAQKARGKGSAAEPAQVSPLPMLCSGCMLDATADPAGSGCGLTSGPSDDHATARNEPVSGARSDGMPHAFPALGFASAGSATSPLLHVPRGTCSERAVLPGVPASHSVPLAQEGSMVLSAAELMALSAAAAALAANPEEAGASAAANQLQLYARMQQQQQLQFGGVSSNPQLAVNRPYEVVSLLDDEDELEVEEGGGQVGGGPMVPGPSFLPAPEQTKLDYMAAVDTMGVGSAHASARDVVPATYSASGGIRRMGDGQKHGYQQQQKQQYQSGVEEELPGHAVHTAPARSSSASPHPGLASAASTRAVAPAAAVGAAAIARSASPFLTASTAAATQTTGVTAAINMKAESTTVLVPSTAACTQLTLSDPVASSCPSSRAAPAAPWTMPSSTAGTALPLSMPATTAAGTAMGGGTLSALLISSLEIAAAKAASSQGVIPSPRSHMPPVKLEDHTAMQHSSQPLGSEPLVPPSSVVQTAGFLEAQQAVWTSCTRSTTRHPTLSQPSARSTTPQPPQLQLPSRNQHHSGHIHTVVGGDMMGGSSAQPSSQASHEGEDGGDGSAPEHPTHVREGTRANSHAGSRAALDRATTINTLASMGVDPVAAALLVDASYGMPVGAMLQPDMQVLLLQLLPPAAAAAAAASTPPAPPMAPVNRAQMDRAMRQLQHRLRAFLQPRHADPAVAGAAQPASMEVTISRAQSSEAAAIEVSGSMSHSGRIGQLQLTGIHGPGYMHAPTSTAPAVRYPPPLMSGSASDYTGCCAAQGGSYGSSVSDACGRGMGTIGGFSDSMATGAPAGQQTSPLQFLDGFPTPPNSSLLNGSFGDLFSLRDFQPSHDGLFHGLLMPAMGAMGSGLDLPSLPHDFMDKVLGALPSPTGSHRFLNAMPNSHIVGLQHANNALQRAHSVSAPAGTAAATLSAAEVVAVGSTTSAASSSYSCPPSSTVAAAGSPSVVRTMSAGGTLSVSALQATALPMASPPEQQMLPLPGSALSLFGSEAMLSQLCRLPSTCSLPKLMSSSSLPSLLPAPSLQNGVHGHLQSQLQSRRQQPLILASPHQHEIKLEQG